MSESIVKKLSTLDRFLPLWIFLAMAAGLVLGKTWPGLGPALDRVKLDTVSLPIAVGLLWMMYPVLAKVRYGELGHLAARGKMLGLSLTFNWIIGPLLMFGLAWLFRTGFTTRHEIRWHTTALTLTSDPPGVPFELDGDNIGPLPARVTVRREALRVLVP